MLPPPLLKVDVCILSRLTGTKISDEELLRDFL